MPNRNSIREMTIESFLASRAIPVPESGCWLWEGMVDDDGYGRLKFSGRRHLAHRIAYELVSGHPPPPGMLVCHRCDIPGCINPAHLFLGRPRDNTHDAMRKGRLASGIKSGAYTMPDSVQRGQMHWSSRRPDRIVRGARNGAAKLTETQVRAIRSDARVQRVIAAEYGVSVRSIERIKGRKLWKHVS